MKGQPRHTAFKCAFELGTGTVLVESAMSAASYICVLRSYALRRGARWYRRAAFPFMFPLRVHYASQTPTGSVRRAVRLRARWDVAVASLSMPVI
jgi:hypothetical protein